MAKQDKYSEIQDLVFQNQERLKVLRKVLVSVLDVEIGSRVRFAVENIKVSKEGVNIVYLKIIDKSSLRFLVIRKNEEIKKIFLEKFGEDLIVK